MFFWKTPGRWQWSSPIHLKAGNSTSPRDAHNLPRCWRHWGLPTWAFHQEHWSMAGLAGLPVRYTKLVGGTHHHPQCEEPKEACPENLHLFFWSWWSDVRPSQAMSTLCLLSPNVLAGICFSPTIHPIMTFDSSLCCWPWLMPEQCSIGWRNLDYQSTLIFVLWQWASWN